MPTCRLPGWEGSRRGSRLSSETGRDGRARDSWLRALPAPTHTPQNSFPFRCLRPGWAGETSVCPLGPAALPSRPDGDLGLLEVSSPRGPGQARELSGPGWARSKGATLVPGARLSPWPEPGSAGDSAASALASGVCVGPRPESVSPPRAVRWLWALPVDGLRRGGAEHVWGESRAAGLRAGAEGEDVTSMVAPGAGPSAESWPRGACGPRGRPGPGWPQRTGRPAADRPLSRPHSRTAPSWQSPC